jgi:hypothetical protein
VNQVEETIVEESLNGLRNSNDPWILAEQHWLLTALIRL